MIFLDMSSLIFIFLVILLPYIVRSVEISFDRNYIIQWGESHFMSLNQGKEIQLMMDRSSGSGFGSKMFYGSGFFYMRIKVPGRDSAGVVTAYYLTSRGDKHDELDFEFLGNREGKPYTLQTNIFIDGEGNREQQIHLWFDPTTNFHDYGILWNQHIIVFYVDNIPIRVYKKKSILGLGYPSKPMQIETTLWDGESWATDGGRTKTNWSCAPFKANFQGFDVSGCETPQRLNARACGSERYWWNNKRHWQLNPAQQKQYENVKKNYMTYDYCNNKQRYPKTRLECQD